MKKKVYGGVFLMLVAILLGVLLYRSGGDRSSLLVDGGVLQPDQAGATGDQLPTIDQAMIDQVFGDVGFSTNDFISAYETALDAHDQFLKLNIAESLYQKTQNPDVLPVLVLLALQHHSLAKAASYIQPDMLNDMNFIRAVGPKVLLRVLFNTQVGNAISINQIKDLVDKIYAEGAINEHDKYFYYSLIAYLREDLYHFDYYTSYLESVQDYTGWYSAVQNTITTADQYEYVPEYYREGLLGIEFFVAGWYVHAHTIGVGLERQDDDYLLGHQLQAYSSLFMGNRTRASAQFEYIRSVDDNDIFLLLQGIALFNDNRYAESILVFRQISDRAIIIDARRYLILAYARAGDQQGVINTIKSLIGNELSPFDYYTIFDLLFFDKESAFVLTQEVANTVDSLLQQCRQDLSESHGFVCLYGRSGYFYLTDDYQRALPVMQSLLRWYPTSAIYERIGEIAYKLDDVELAKESFIKAFAATSDNSQLLYLRQRITSLLAL